MTSRSHAKFRSYFFLLFAAFFFILPLSHVFAEPYQISVVNDRDYYPTLLELLDKTERSIDIAAFEFISGSGETRKISGKLAEIARRIPTGRFRFFFESDKSGLGEKNQRTASFLENFGFQIFPDSRDSTTHLKAVCIDDRWLLVGSTNLSNNSFQNNNETNVLIHSPILGTAFKQYFDELTGSSIDSGPSAISDGQVTLLFDDAYYEVLTKMVQSAKKEIQIFMYMIFMENKPDGKVEKILEEIGKRKDQVNVRMILDQSRHFSTHITRANQKVAEFLGKRGISQIFFDRPDKFSHVKLVIKDGEEVLLGSTNWYWPNDHSRQLNIHIRDPKIAREFLQYFQKKLAEETEPAIQIPARNNLGREESFR